MTFDKQLFVQFSTFIQKVEPIFYKKIITKWGFIEQSIKRNLYAWLVGAIIGQKIRFKNLKIFNNKICQMSSFIFLDF